ncbi:hypothetical protein L1887_48919 [Cichorium endivia]|nr:hypothetical protein L1887_48919 [Cichorium endivia]
MRSERCAKSVPYAHHLRRAQIGAVQYAVPASMHVADPAPTLLHSSTKVAGMWPSFFRWPPLSPLPFSEVHPLLRTDPCQLITPLQLAPAAAAAAARLGLRARPRHAPLAERSEPPQRHLDGQPSSSFRFCSPSPLGLRMGVPS